MLDDPPPLTGDLDSWQVRNDLIDDLIETVITRGGWVALVDDGRLSGHHRVALTLRPTTGSRATTPAPATTQESR